MTVKIRLARFGRRNAPFYNIVIAHARLVSAAPASAPPSRPAAADSPSTRTARNSRPIEVIGTYDPKPKPDPYDDSGRLHKDIKLDTLRAKYWIGVGAQPTESVWRMLAMVSLSLHRREHRRLACRSDGVLHSSASWSPRNGSNSP